MIFPLSQNPLGGGPRGPQGLTPTQRGLVPPRSPLDCRPRDPQAMMLLPSLPQGKVSDPFRFTTFYIYFALVLSALILSCFREKPPFFSPKNIDPVSFNGVGW